MTFCSAALLMVRKRATSGDRGLRLEDDIESVMSSNSTRGGKPDKYFRIDFVVPWGPRWV